MTGWAHFVSLQDGWQLRNAVADLPNNQLKGFQVKLQCTCSLISVSSPSSNDVKMTIPCDPYANKNLYTVLNTKHYKL